MMKLPSSQSNSRMWKTCQYSELFHKRASRYEFFLLQWLTILTIMHDIMDSLNYDKLVAFSISLKPLNLSFNAQCKGVFACYVTFQKAFWIPQKTLFLPATDGN